MRLSKWTLFCALLLTAALSLTGCMNAGDRGAAPSPSAGATAGTGSVGDAEDEVPLNPILREFIGGCCFYRETD